MKKHPIISTVCYVAGIIAILSLILYLLRDYVKLPFFDAASGDEPEDDVFETPADEGADTIPSAVDEKRPSQTKIRRGYIPVKFHTRESEEA